MQKPKEVVLMFFFKNFTMFRRALDAGKLYLSLLLHHIQHIIIIRTTPFDARQDPFYGTYDFHVLQGSIFQQCPNLVQKDHKKVMLRMRSKLLGLDFETVFQDVMFLKN